MGEQEPRWTRRHKRRARRMAYDVRLFAPLVALVLCLAGSATAILAVERSAPSTGADRTTSSEGGPNAPADACRPGSVAAR